jgi:hypothetical protein
MRTTDTGLSCPWVFGTVLLFTMTLTMVVHSSTAVIFTDKKPGNYTHTLIDTQDLSVLILHSVAYYFACFATTVFLLMCAAIILGLATICMEFAEEGFYITRGIMEAWQNKRDRHRQQMTEKEHGDTDTETDTDTNCDTWNSR